MATKLSSKNMVINESQDKLLLSVSVRATAAGSSFGDISYYVYNKPLVSHVEPFLCGGDYPSLVRVWDNKDDDIFDNI